MVREVQRKFLDHIKSAQLMAAGSEDATQNEGDPEPTDIRITSDGFPILPKLVRDRILNKSESEKLLRSYLTHHYCE